MTGKLPGKSTYSGRRRSVTRKSGYGVHPGATGGAIRKDLVDSYRVAAGESLAITFAIPTYPVGSYIGYGGWFSSDQSVDVEIISSVSSSRHTCVIGTAPNWGKVGSMWKTNGTPEDIRVIIRPTQTAHIALWEMTCGRIDHEFLVNARAALLPNMYEFSPEAHFFVDQGTTTIHAPVVRRISERPKFSIVQKQCNRCARFLPINIANERLHLSFSNHCVAAHRRPCSHATFGRLRDTADGREIRLEYGFQLECRFCKKFAVNAPHNPQRTSSQMKEDAARRRHTELLLTELYGASPQLQYRHQKDGKELAQTVWQRFDKKCFNCELPIESPNRMFLDHTRPLALLWPLDDSATALCQTCNAKKRDRPPAEFYTAAQLVRLAHIAGVSVTELQNPSPNVDAIRLLKKRLGWFFETFLCKPELVRERDGKTAAELLVKALQKTINKAPLSDQFDLIDEFERRRST